MQRGRDHIQGDAKLMASDYASIRADNERRYGTDIGRIGPMLLADRYDDRTHFIFELLQNAEDALARRAGRKGRGRHIRAVRRGLRVSHFGKPFDDRDVRGICGIAESTKDLTAIGRFGIGFKSVYTFTDRPEDPLRRRGLRRRELRPAERLRHGWIEATTRRSFSSPSSAGRGGPRGDRQGLQRLGPGALLFLRHIEEINWSVEGGPSGLYMRGKPEALGENVRRITVIGQEEGKPEVEETWLVFSREARPTRERRRSRGDRLLDRPGEGIPRDGRFKPSAIRPSLFSSLPCFRRTSAFSCRALIARRQAATTCPQRSVESAPCPGTAALLVEAFRWLRDHGMLDTAALRCLPLDRAKFPEGSMFAPLFEATRTAWHPKHCFLVSMAAMYLPAGEARAHAGTARALQPEPVGYPVQPRRRACLAEW